jgi:DNA-binding response OmpR family regulator
MTTANTSPQTILVVDDDRELSDGLRAVLERRGYRVLQATNGIQAREMVHQHRPDLMVLDMMMPRMGGFPVLEHFRGRTDAPPIIMITANEGSRHKAYAEYLGVIDYIRKPFAMDELLESIDRSLSAAASAQQTDEGQEPEDTSGPKRPKST